MHASRSHVQTYLMPPPLSWWSTWVTSVKDVLIRSYSCFTVQTSSVSPVSSCCSSPPDHLKDFPERSSCPLCYTLLLDVGHRLLLTFDSRWDEEWVTGAGGDKTCYYRLRFSSLMVSILISFIDPMGWQTHLCPPCKLIEKAQVLRIYVFYFHILALCPEHLRSFQCVELALF